MPAETWVVQTFLRSWREREREPVAPIARSNGVTTRTASPHRVRQVIGSHRSCKRPTPIKYRDYRTIK